VNQAAESSSFKMAAANLVN